MAPFKHPYQSHAKEHYLDFSIFDLTPFQRLVAECIMLSDHSNRRALDRSITKILANYIRQCVTDNADSKLTTMELDRLENVEEAADLDNELDQFLMTKILTMVATSTGSTKCELLTAFFIENYHHFMDGDEIDPDLGKSAEWMFLSEEDGVSWKYYKCMVRKCLSVTGAVQRPFESLAVSLARVKQLARKGSPSSHDAKASSPQEAPVMPGVAVAPPALAAQLRDTAAHRVILATVKTNETGLGYHSRAVERVENSFGMDPAATGDEVNKKRPAEVSLRSSDGSSGDSSTSGDSDMSSSKKARRIIAQGQLDHHKTM
jgi:hypothetical protein